MKGNLDVCEVQKRGFWGKERGVIGTNQYKEYIILKCNESKRSNNYVNLVLVHQSPVFLLDCFRTQNRGINHKSREDLYNKIGGNANV